MSSKRLFQCFIVVKKWGKCVNQPNTFEKLGGGTSLAILNMALGGREAFISGDRFSPFSNSKILILGAMSIWENSNLHNGSTIEITYFNQFNIFSKTLSIAGSSK
jgi:hypothetical protein